MINVKKLTEELIAAGIPIYGCSSDGRIDLRPEATPEQIALAEKIKANHNPYDYVEFRLKEGRPNVYVELGEEVDYLFKAFREFRNTGITDWKLLNEWIDKTSLVKKRWEKKYEDLTIEDKKIVDEFYNK